MLDRIGPFNSTEIPIHLPKLQMVLFQTEKSGTPGLKSSTPTSQGEGTVPGSSSSSNNSTPQLRPGVAKQTVESIGREAQRRHNLLQRAEKCRSLTPYFPYAYFPLSLILISLVNVVGRMNLFCFKLFQEGRSRREFWRIKTWL